VRVGHSVMANLLIARKIRYSGRTTKGGKSHTAI
jgi:hypothetical protein